MEQQQRSLIFTAAVGLIILAIIVGSIYYLVKFIQTRVSSSRQLPQASVESVAEASASPIENIQGEQTAPSATQTIPTPQTGESKGGVVSADKKVFNGGTFQLSYPKNWGFLTCTNSKNIELDPLSSSDSKIACDIAVKPITILISDIRGCQGEAVKIGNLEVIKSKQTVGGYTTYQWCTKTTPALNITHRVSKGGEKAVSPNDYSTQIEDMIAKVTFSSGS